MTVSSPTLVPRSSPASTRGLPRLTLTTTVYLEPASPRSQDTVAALNAAGVPHRVVDVTKDRIAARILRSAGYQHFPVVLTTRADLSVEAAHTWAGYRPDRIAQLAADTAAEG
ncbi:MAG TPA: hypothetical protein VIG75_09285 [Citricoccus sp.]